MPTIVRLRLMPQRDTALRLENTPAQGWFLALARLIDADWSAYLHGSATSRSDAPRRRDDDMRPYALSPLHRFTDQPLWKDDEIGGRALRTTAREDGGLAPRPVRAGEPLALRLAFLRDDDAHRLCDALRHVDALPPLGDASCLLQRLPSCAEDDPDLLHADWSVLADSPASERLHAAFTTPTYFGSGDDSVLFPEPARLLESWGRSWRRWSPVPLPEMEPDCAHRLRVAWYELRTQSLRLKGAARPGFVGWVEMEWKPGASHPSERRAVAALAALANFCGTGAKTALGMGQTRAGEALRP